MYFAQALLYFGESWYLPFSKKRCVEISDICQYRVDRYTQIIFFKSQIIYLITWIV